MRLTFLPLPAITPTIQLLSFAAQGPRVRSAAGVQTGDASPGEAPEPVGHQLRVTALHDFLGSEQVICLHIIIYCIIYSIW